MRSVHGSSRHLRIILLILLWSLVISFLIFYFKHAKPWGADRIREKLELPEDHDLMLNDSMTRLNSCSGCVLGRNTDWPTKSSGIIHFLDSYARHFVAGCIAIVVSMHSSVAIAFMIWPNTPDERYYGRVISNGIVELWHLIEIGQLIGMISQLQLRGTPYFLNRFSRSVAWTNFVIPSRSDDRQSDKLLVGPEGYARLLGIKPSKLFGTTILTYIAIFAITHVLCLLSIMLVSFVRKIEELGDVIRYWYRRVVYCSLFILLLAEYSIVMSGSNAVYISLSNQFSLAYGVLYLMLLVLVIGFTSCVGFFVLSQIQHNMSMNIPNDHYIEDFEEQFEQEKLRSSSTMSKFGIYFEGYSYFGRHFFLYRIACNVCIGLIVGLVQNASSQLSLLITVSSFYSTIFIWKDPMQSNYLRTVGIITSFTKLTLLFQLCFLTHTDFFTQHYRDKVSYLIILQSMLLIGILFARHIYLMRKAIEQVHKNWKKHGSEALRIARRHESQRRSHTQLYFEVATPNVEGGRPSGTFSAVNESNTTFAQKTDPAPELTRRVTWFETLLRATGLSSMKDGHRSGECNENEMDLDASKLLDPSTLSGSQFNPPPSRNPFSGSHFSVFSRGGQPHSSIFHFFRNTSSKNHKVRELSRKMSSSQVRYNDVVDLQLELGNLGAEALKRSHTTETTISNCRKLSLPTQDRKNKQKSAPMKGILSTKSLQGHRLSSAESRENSTTQRLSAFNARNVKVQSHVQDHNISVGSSEFGSSQLSQLDDWLGSSVNDLVAVDRESLQGTIKRRSVYSVLKRVGSSDLSQTTLDSMAEACLAHTGNPINSTTENEVTASIRQIRYSIFPEKIPVLQSDEETSEFCEAEEDTVIAMLSDDDGIRRFLFGH